MVRSSPRGNGSIATTLLKVGLLSFLIGWAIVQLFPMLFMFLQALKTDHEIVYDMWALPAQPQFGNFLDAWTGGRLGVPIGQYFLNSVIVTSGTLLLLTITGALAGYALARFRFPGDGLAQLSLIWALAVPVHALLVPVFLFMGTLGLRNSYVGLIGVYTAFWLPFTILLMRAYFKSFPREIEESARMDGCTDLGVFFRIVMPMSRGALASVAIVNVVGIWSELLFAFVLMNKEGWKTLTVGMLAFRGQYSVEWSTVFAGLAIATMPTLLLFLIFQRQITKGMTMGALR